MAHTPHQRPAWHPHLPTKDWGAVPQSNAHSQPALWWAMPPAAAARGDTGDPPSSASPVGLLAAELEAVPAAFVGLGCELAPRLWLPPRDAQIAHKKPPIVEHIETA